MSFETPKTSSKEGLTEAFRAFSAQIEAGKTEISDLRQSVWQSRDLTQTENAQLLNQLVEAELLLGQQDNYVQKAA